MVGLTMVDESGLMLRQLMRQARQRERRQRHSRRSPHLWVIGGNPNAFRLLLRERSGTSAAFRAPSRWKFSIFIAELADYLEPKTICRAHVLLKPGPSDGDYCL